VWIAVVVLIGLTGAVVGRWWILLLPFVLCPIYFLGIARSTSSESLAGGQASVTAGSSAL
jgi:hypothetical protein